MAAKKKVAKVPSLEEQVAELRRIIKANFHDLAERIQAVRSHLRLPRMVERHNEEQDRPADPGSRETARPEGGGGQTGGEAPR